VHCKICLDKDDLPPTAPAGVRAGVVARTPLRAVTNETRMIYFTVQYIVKFVFTKMAFWSASVSADARAEAKTSALQNWNFLNKLRRPSILI